MKNGMADCSYRWVEDEKDEKNEKDEKDDFLNDWWRVKNNRKFIFHQNSNIQLNYIFS